MTTAKRISRNLVAKGIERTSPGAIYCVLMDGDRSLCMTEAALDTWWANLSAEVKAEICEMHHDGPGEADVVDQQRAVDPFFDSADLTALVDRAKATELAFDDIFHRPISRYAHELWAPEGKATR